MRHWVWIFSYREVRCPEQGGGIIKAGSFLLGKYKHSMENTASETSASTSLLNINEDRVMIPRIDCLDWR